MPGPKEDTKLQVLQEHYSETCCHIQENRKSRDRLLGLILVVVTAMLFQIYAPQEAGSALSEFIAKTLGLQSPIDISFVGSVVWLALLGLVVRYFQAVVHLERQYDYIHALEEQISPLYGGKAFTREGKSYLAAYSLFSNWAWLLYTWIFPTILTVVTSVKLAHEIILAKAISPLLVINALLFVCILVSVVLYLVTIHQKQ